MSKKSSVEMVKVFDSPTYGKYNWSYLGTLSIFTFDAEESKEICDEFFNVHPKHNFSSFSTSKVDDQNGVFEVWVPLCIMNKGWEYTGTNLAIKTSCKKGQIPYGVSNAHVIKWFKKAEKFMTDVNDELIDMIYDEYEKEKPISVNSTLSSKSEVRTKQYPSTSTKKRK